MLHKRSLAMGGWLLAQGSFGRASDQSPAATGYRAASSRRVITAEIAETAEISEATGASTYLLMSASYPQRPQRWVFWFFVRAAYAARHRTEE